MAFWNFLGSGNGTAGAVSPAAPGFPLLTLVKASAARKLDAETRLKFYRDLQTDDLLSLIRARWSKPEQFRLFSINIVRKIIDKKSMVYAREPKRVFDGWDQAKGDALYAALGANVLLKKANRLTKLCKTTALQVLWPNDAPSLAVITPNILDAVYDDPQRPDRIIVTRRHAPDSGLVYQEQLTNYSDWTPTSYTRRDWRGAPIANPDNPDNVNPYGVLPFVPLFDYSPDERFFLEGGADLVEAQRAINVALASLWRAIELQSHGQAYAVGLPPGDVIRTGPDRAVTLPPGGSFGYAAPENPIEEVLQAIEFLIKQTAIANDLATNVFDLNAKAESGAAKDAEKADLLEARTDDIALWRRYEAQLFEVLKIVVNTHKPGTIPDAATLTVDFGDITAAQTDAERVNGYQARIDMGIWSPVDALLADNPDYGTREDAVAELERRALETARIGPPRPPGIPGLSLGLGRPLSTNLNGAG